MYKEDYIISNSAERISPIISGSYYSSKPEKLTAGETFGIPFSGEPLLAPPQEEECDVSESDARCRELGGGKVDEYRQCVRRHVQRERDGARFQGHLQSQGTC